MSRVPLGCPSVLILRVLARAALVSAGCHPSPPPTSPARCDLSSVVLDDLQGRAFPDPTGALATRSETGAVDRASLFFADLGGNGRRCVSCHVPQQGWTIGPGYLRDVFDRTAGGACDDGRGLSAVFRPVDGATSPEADVSTLPARRRAYQLLLSRGLVRIELPVPADAEFEVTAVDDPYHHATPQRLSLYRRPLPTTNVKFLSTVMWDGREVQAGLSVADELANQVATAATVHAQAQAPIPATRAQVVQFELGLATAQVSDRAAGDLVSDGGDGGPQGILDQPFHVGINDNLGDSVTGAAFDPVVFRLYDAWASPPDDDARSAARRSVARGQTIFNQRPVPIRGVSGINDEPKLGSPQELVGTCTTCHDVPGGGDHSVVAPLDIGIADAARRRPDVPLYALRNKATGQVVQVTDPGRGLVDGKWAHVGRFKGPVLRDLAVRAPYFHDGSADDLDAVVDFYDGRFGLDLSPQDHQDLVAFLRTL